MGHSVQVGADFNGTLALMERRFKENTDDADLADLRGFYNNGTLMTQILFEWNANLLVVRQVWRGFYKNGTLMTRIRRIGAD